MICKNKVTRSFVLSKIIQKPATERVGAIALTLLTNLSNAEFKLSVAESAGDGEGFDIFESISGCVSYVCDDPCSCEHCCVSDDIEESCQHYVSACERCLSCVGKQCEEADPVLLLEATSSEAGSEARMLRDLLVSSAAASSIASAENALNKLISFVDKSPEDRNNRERYLSILSDLIS